MMLALTMSLAATLGLGCTWSNAPERALEPGQGSSVELLCGNGLDDDGDGKFDCDDPHCATQLSCCETLPGSFSKPWPIAPPSERWLFLPTDWVPEMSADGEELTRFPEEETHALLSDDCVPMALGATITTTVELADDRTPLPAEEACDQFAGILLTDSPETMGEQSGVAVSVCANGAVHVADNGVEFPLDRLRLEPGARYTLEVSLQPSADGEEVGLYASLVLTRAGEPPLMDETLSLDVLSRSGSCAAERGLYPGIWGRGAGVRLGTLRISGRRACQRHGGFKDEDFLPDLTPATDDWELTQIGAPTLVSSRPKGASDQWELWAEGSGEPHSDPLATFGLWSAKITNDGDWNTTTEPALGGSHSTLDAPSVREPHILAQPDSLEHQSEWLLAFAEELPEEERFGIGFRRHWSIATSEVRLPSISPDEVPGCSSLRDPALLHVDPELRDGYWLFFTCEHGGEDAGERASDIRALRLEPDLRVRSAAGVSKVLSSLQEDYGQADVRAPEPLISFSPSGIVLRLWFLAESAAGETSVALATAQLSELSTLSEGLPALRLYPANPILTKDSGPLARACKGLDCRIQGFAVAPHAGAPNEKIRFVVAQHEDGALDRVVTFEQDWEIPAH